jgi:diaminopimelate epimerase
MQIHFVKYHGTGNDFILLDDRKCWFKGSSALTASLCDRHFGVGADGILLLRDRIGYDFEMIYYNADGSAASFCGNGGRCIVAFANSLGIIHDNCHFIAPDGEHTAGIIKKMANETFVSLQMSDAIVYEHSDDHVYLNTGTYHYVEFVETLNNIDLTKHAREIRYSGKYAPHGTNVNLVKIDNSHHLTVRTYEKGVEDETLSCGTGVTASAIAASLLVGGNQWSIQSSGGQLDVHFDRDGDAFTHIFLQGPATRVFEGIINI